jgi:hypothetical protein
LLRAVAAFAVDDLPLVIDPAAAAAAEQSLADAGLLLLGEIHGAAENPLVIRALMREFGLTRLALEWADDLAPIIASYLAAGTLADDWLLWSGDGRITAGHLAVLSEQAAAGPLEIVLFDGVLDAGWSWSQRDEAMADRILAAATPGTRTLVVAGNAHTPTAPTDLGVPLGAQLARQRPGVREIRIRYGSGTIYNCGPRRVRSAGQQARVDWPPRRRPVRGQPALILLHEEHGALVLELPAPTEAVVPHRRHWPLPLPLSR